jgi:hypothetical protein
MIISYTSSVRCLPDVAAVPGGGLSTVVSWMASGLALLLPLGSLQLLGNDQPYHSYSIPCWRLLARKRATVTFAPMRLSDSTRFCRRTSADSILFLDRYQDWYPSGVQRGQDHSHEYHRALRSLWRGYAARKPGVSGGGSDKGSNRKSC